MSIAATSKGWPGEQRSSNESFTTFEYLPHDVVSEKLEECALLHGESEHQ